MTLKELAEKATFGEWTYKRYSEFDCKVFAGGVLIASCMTQWDAMFIVQAHNTLIKDEHATTRPE